MNYARRLIRQREQTQPSPHALEQWKRNRASSLFFAAALVVLTGFVVAFLK